MTRRKGEIRRADLNRKWPHHVVLLADKVRGAKSGEIVRSFANALSVGPLTYSISRADVDLVVFYFAKPEDADMSCNRLGGERSPRTWQP